MFRSPWPAPAGLCLWLLAAPLSCAPGGLPYRPGPLPAGWAPAPVRGASFVYHDRAGGTIAAHRLCRHDRDAPLDVLMNYLFFGLRDVHEGPRAHFTLDGRAALRTRATATLDGVPVGLDLVVLKKDGCTYDLQLVAAPDQVAAREPAFSAFVQGFHTLPPG